MPEALDGLTCAQAAAARHRGGPLVLLGGPGTGKTRLLVERFGVLVEDGTPPEAILLLAASGPAADELRICVEAVLGDRPFEELAVSTVPSWALRLLRDEALEARLDPFVLPVTPADRLAMLLDRMEELPLAAHDLAGNPAAALARVVARIDRCKEEGVRAADHAAWAARLDEGAAATAREREFAALYAAHDAMLAARGALDTGDLVLRATDLLRARPHVRARTAARFRHVLADDHQDLSFAEARLVSLLAGAHGHLVAAVDPDACLVPHARLASRSLRDLRAANPDLTELRLDRSFRCPARVLAAADAVVADLPERDLVPPPVGPTGGEVHFWRCANERAQAQAVAAEVERLVREGTPPERIGVLVRSVRHEGQAVAVALEERAVPHRLVGAAAFFQRAEVRDVLAWLRLLVDPSDAGAVVRALARPPVELRSADLARCIQIARRRKLDMVSALAAATESPQLPPEARERILGFLKLQRQAAAALDSSRPDLFVHRLIERLGLRRQGLFAAQADAVERLLGLARIGELAARHVRRSPQATPREFARHLAAVADAGLREEDADAGADATGPAEDMVSVVAMHGARGQDFDHVFVLGLQSSRMPGARSALVEPVPDALLDGELPADGRDAHVAHMRRLLRAAMTRSRRSLVLAYAAAGSDGARQNPSPMAEEARLAVGGTWEDRAEELFGPDEELHAMYTTLREELLRSVPAVGTRLGELRFDTDLDVSHGVTRYLEMVKVAALLERPAGQSVAEALVDVNSRLLQAASSSQREALETSNLDAVLLGAERDARARAAALAAREEPSLEPFLPKRGAGLMLSASDIETYRTCPLKYKFARVFRIPSEPTMNQRFGILVHQVLERFHQAGGAGAGGGRGSRAELLGLLDAGWRRGGFGDTEEERQFRAKATSALARYHERHVSDRAEPVWLEKAFQFKLGPHVLRGRVDRVDRLPDGTYELIDYKTGRPRTVAQLREDVQLSLYAVAAREAWQLESSREAYLYVLDDEKVRVPAEEIDEGWITDTVMEVADGILGQGFEPTPSYSACSMCDFRIACPAAER